MEFSRTALVVFAGATFALAPHIALGGTLATGAIYAGMDQEAIICVATNVSNKTIPNVTAKNISTAGETLDATTCSPLVPGGVCQSVAYVASHCRFDFDAPKEAVRASGSVNDSRNNIQAVEPAR